MSTVRVLVVEDDHRLRDVLARGLRAHEFEVVSAVDGTTALASLDPVPDAIVLDIGLPDSDGRDVCQAIRSRGIDAPVIFLTARRELHDRMAGFGAGGDDYLGKPFAFPELVARLRALLRRHVQRQTVDAHDRLTLDPSRHCVSWNGHSTELSPTEYKLLAALLAAPEEIVRRRALREAGWPMGAIVSENTLDQYLSRLRRKLTAVGAPHAIRSARGLGYQVVVDDATPADGTASSGTTDRDVAAQVGADACG